MKPDQITLDRINLLHPKIREEVKTIYLNEVVPALTGKAMVRFAFTLRTFDEQNKIYQQGRTTSGPKVTNAKPGQSLHNYGLAFDIALCIDKDGNGTYETSSWDTIGDYDGDHVSDWMEVISIYRNHGYEWGGSWTSLKDYPHLQKTFGLTWQDLYIRYQAKKFIPGTTYVQI
jgi:peptidoglycan L-alanyl-D-glutamate endopeptidase CwlK